MDNRLSLRARIASREALRYTPAGVPVLSFSAEHRSSQREAGQPRDVSLELDCIVIGDNAKILDELGTGQDLEMTGFLSNRSRKSRWVVFHVVEFEVVRRN